MANLPQALMNYTVDPTRFQVGSTSATLQVVASAKKVGTEEGADPWDPPLQHDDVYLHEITIDIGVDGAAADLTGNPSVMKISTPTGWREIDRKWKFGPLSDWTFSHEPRTGGTFVAKPKTPIKVDKDTTIHLVLSNITINDSPTSKITITEQASLGSATAAPQKSTQSDELHCFSDFQVGQLWADNNYIKYDDSVALSWAGSEGADYSLHWMQDNKPMVIDGLPSSSSQITPEGGFIVKDLKDKFITFELKTDPAPKEHHPNLCQIWVSQPQPKFNSFEIEEKGTEELLLKWDTENYESVKITYGPDDLLLSTSGVHAGSVVFSHAIDNQHPPDFTLTAIRPNGEGTSVWKLERAFVDVPGSPITNDKRLPDCIAASSDGSRLFVGEIEVLSRSAARTETQVSVSVLDAHTFEPLPGSPCILDDTSNPSEIFVSPDKNHFYVLKQGGYGDPRFAKYDTKTLRQITRVFVSRNTWGVCGQSSDRSQLYVVDNGSLNTDLPAIQVLSSDTMQDISPPNNSIKIEAITEMAGSNGQSKRLFLSGYGQSEIVVVDQDTLAPVPGSPISTSLLSNMAISPDGHRMFACGDGVIHSYDTQSLKQLAVSTLKFGKSRLTVSGDGKMVLVIDNETNTLIGLDSSSLVQATQPRTYPNRSKFSSNHYKCLDVSPNNPMRVYVPEGKSGVFNIHRCCYVQSDIWGLKEDT